jgi:hypothetical protein
MHKKLISKAFAKARQQLLSKNGIEPSKTKCASFLSDFLQQCKFQYSTKSLVNHFNAVDNGNEALVIKQPQVVEGLSVFLGYDDYIDFCNDHRDRLDTHQEIKEAISDKQVVIKNNSWLIRNKFMVAVGIIVLIMGALFLWQDAGQQRWMEWQVDHYEEVDFSTVRFNQGQLKLWNETRVKNFKKVSVDCNTMFYNVQGDVQIWYGKNKSGDLDYFTSTGKHPYTQKLVKPITVYMIRKYVCARL